MTRERARNLLLAAALFASCAGAAFAAPLRVGAAAPNIVGQTVDGQSFDLAALRGHVVVVDVWATWCAPCRVEMPILSAFYSAHRDQGLVMIGASADRPRDAADVRRAMTDMSYPALILRSAQVNELGLPGAVPETIVIDRAGVVRAVITPRRDASLSMADLDAAVLPLLADDAPQHK